MTVLEPLSPMETEVSLTATQGLRENAHYVVHVAASNSIGRTTSQVNLCECTVCCCCTVVLVDDRRCTVVCMQFGDY